MKPDMIDLFFKTLVANECNDFASLYERIQKQLNIYKIRQTD